MSQKTKILRYDFYMVTLDSNAEPNKFGTHLTLLPSPLPFYICWIKFFSLSL